MIFLQRIYINNKNKIKTNNVLCFSAGRGGGGGEGLE